MTQILFFILISFCSLNRISAQQPTYFEQLGNLGGEEGLFVQKTSKYSLLAGSFQQIADIYGTSLQSKGDSDGWISLLDSSSMPIWTSQIASSKTIQVTDLQIDSAQNVIYALGSFSDSLWVAEYHYYSSSNSIFLIKYAIEGNVLWVKTFGAAYFAKPTALCLNTNKIHLTGSYQDSLEVDNVVLNTSSTKNAFILTFASNGQVLWGYSFPKTFDAEGVALTANEQGQLYWAGNFKGQLISSKDSFLANVVYPDIFLCKLDTLGQLLWIKGFAGVYTDEVVEMHYYKNHLYLAGQFMGLLHLGQFKLATAYRYYDLFLAKLDSMANPIWVRQSNSHKVHSWLKKMTIQEQKIALVGGFEGYLNVANQAITAKGKIDGFCGLFSMQGNLEAVQGFGGKGNDMAQGVSIGVSKITIVGTFQDSLNYDGLTYRAKGYSDAFVASIPNNSPVLLPSQLIEATLVPTASQDSLWIQIKNTKQVYWQLYNTKGQVVLKGDEMYIPLQSLAKGIYSLQLNNEEGFAVLKVVKN